MKGRAKGTPLRGASYDQNKKTIAFKWGFDGASGHSQYMQRFENSDNDDESLYLVSLFPRRMTVLSKIGNRKFILWNNPVPSSTNYYRPIRIVFHKETPNFVKQQVEDIKRQILRIVPPKTEYTMALAQFF
ncbi:hypothetical protein J437_LFUL012061 [Ladona fulva]|uniref:Uncharacterized protein n=1 Tax=Ladona fulva TaxID=123851 RepID=A0A8K0KBQ5_LADFU|nr:hypothetical protein J437_LFUL012061 [Ladona fulva]